MYTHTHNIRHFVASLTTITSVVAPANTNWCLYWYARWNSNSQILSLSSYKTKAPATIDGTTQCVGVISNSELLYSIFWKKKLQTVWRCSWNRYRFQKCPRGAKSHTWTKLHCDWILNATCTVIAWIRGQNVGHSKMDEASDSKSIGIMKSISV